MGAHSTWYGHPYQRGYGAIAEFPRVISRGFSRSFSVLPEILEDAENGLSGASRTLFARLFEHFRALDRHVDEIEREINA